MRLIRSLLENIMKSKVMKKRNNLPVPEFEKYTVERKHLVPG